MAHDVFISYSSKDTPVAEAVCATLEGRGIRCWIAPRDVVAGESWPSAIIEAIEGCHIMVLIFSSNSNASSQVVREVDRAISKGVIVMPLRIKDIPMNKDLEYFLSAAHWLDAFTPPLELHLSQLADNAKKQMIRAGKLVPLSGAEQSVVEKPVSPPADAPLAAPPQLIVPPSGPVMRRTKSRAPMAAPAAAKSAAPKKPTSGAFRWAPSKNRRAPYAIILGGLLGLLVLSIVLMSVFGVFSSSSPNRFPQESMEPKPPPPWRGHQSPP